MTEKLIWECDGCGAEKVVKGSHGDWKLADVTLGGFQGYPTCAGTPVVEFRFNLCPDCARRYYDNANPRNWPRAIPADPSPPSP